MALNLSNTHNRILAKEILNQTQNQIKKQKETVTISKDTSSNPSKDSTPQKFEPTQNFSTVFSEHVGKKTEPTINARFKENPRLITLNGKNSQGNNEKDAGNISHMSPKEIRLEHPSEKEPTPKFFKVLSGVIGENKQK